MTVNAPFIRAYLRASTADQDASRARQDLERFAGERGLRIASWYTENESGTKLDRPELHRLLDDAQDGDIMLVEQVDRLTRLRKEDWETLRANLTAKRVRVVSLDLPTSWQMIRGEDFTGWVFEAVNGMMLDMLAAMARKDYEDRRRRQAQGIAKAKTKGKMGRPEDKERNAAVASMLRDKQPWSSIMKVTGCSRATVAKVAKMAAERTV